MNRLIWQNAMANDLVRHQDEVNRENRLAIRLLSIAGIPLGVANVIVQVLLSSEAEAIPFFLRTSWLLAYFVALLVIERWIMPEDYRHTTLFLYIAELPVVLCSILLGSIWDPGHQAITFFVFLMAMPMFILDRPIRVMLVTTSWVAVFLLACYFAKPLDIFERDLLHAFEFYLASVATATVVLRIRIIALEQRVQAKYNLEHDELTNLRNRRSLRRHIGDYLNKPMTILIVELDQLNMYSDSYGQDTGDQLFVKFTKILSTVFGHGKTYRYGGNRVLCVTEGESERECLASIKACRAKLLDCQLDGRALALTCAVGYTTGSPQTEKAFRQMAQLADIYGHKAGSKGKGQTVGGPFDEDSLRASIVESNIATNVRAYETNQLTGLPSMSYFISRADEMLAGIIYVDRDPMIGFLNLPFLKSYNSEFGYEQGDELIRYTAQLLCEAFPKRLVCCISGGHFGVMCYKDDIDAGMHQIDEGLRGFKENVSIVCKAGFAQYVEGESAISLFDKARVAERSIRDDEKALFRFYDEQLDADAKFHEYIVSHLDEAIERGFLEVYYQPIIRTSSREICNEEALSRWNDPERGLLAPYLFIPPLEESRQIYKLSLYVVRRVLADLERKRASGMNLVPVSVNLSRHDFEQCDMVQAITDLVDASGFSHDMIRIEITESAFMRNQEFLKREVARFRENGFQVWMDDFGSEYSTLNLLQDLDVDLIKLDMQFMRTSSDSGKNLIIVSSVIDMAKQMGVATLVEGVESEEHMGILRAMGSDKLQGFLFGKPIPLEDVINLTTEGNYIPFEKHDV